MFKNDPLFNYEFTQLPKGYFLKIVELRKKRLETAPPDLSDALTGQ